MKRYANHAPYLWYVLLVLLLAGCTQRLIALYDESTDTSLTEIQKKTDSFIEKLKANDESPASSFANSKAFYDEIETEIKTLLFRVRSIPKNGPTETLVNNVLLLIVGNTTTPQGTSLRELHQMPPSGNKVVNRSALELAQRNINQALHDALSLELAKKSRK